MTDAEKFAEDTAAGLAGLLLPLAVPAVRAIVRLVTAVVRHPSGAEVAAERALMALSAKAAIRR